MAKNLITHLEIPFERKHEIAWLLVKNDFKAHEQLQDIFYNPRGNLIHLKYLNKTKGPYEFDIHTFEEDIEKEKIHISGYEGIEKFVKSL